MALFRRIHPSSVVALALVALVLPVVIGTALFHLASANRGLAETAVLRSVQRENAELLKLQLDEETGLRGLVVTGHRAFLDPYETAQTRFPIVFGELWADLGRLGSLGSLRDEAAELGRLHEAWATDVAAPVLQHGTSVGVQSRGKADIDRFREVSASIDRVVNAEATARRDTAQSDLTQGVALFSAAIALFFVAVLIFTTNERRLRSDLDRERSIVASLQRAFVGEKEAMATLDVGAVYRSATKGTFVGGDVFDVYPLPDRRALVMVADVSGKGVEAAVETAFVKYAVRALSRVSRSPTDIVSQVNEMYMQDLERRESGSFIVLFLGILDFEAGELRYTSAGHSGAFLRAGSGVRMLGVTGPALGIVDAPMFAEKSARLEPADMLLVATDGLTESRDAAGALLTDEGLATWFSESSATASAQDVVDALVARAFSRSDGRISDDLAAVCARITAAGERADVPRAEPVARPLRSRR